MASYAAYLRKSRSDVEAEAHGQGETLLRHENALMALAKQMKISVTMIYREVVSGDSIESRPQVQQLLHEVEQGLYDGVLVMDIDRLARGDTVDQGIIARTFKLSNTKIITPKKVYDPESEFDEEYFEFELFMARREYKIINRRIQRGRIASVNDGKYIGSTAPYGYNKVKIKNGKGYTLEHNHETETVRLIYDLYLHGNGMTTIANTLDGMHIKPRNRDTWSKSTIRDILRNPVYIGKIRWSYRPDLKVSVNGKLQKSRHINNDCTLVDGIHPPIISATDYDKVQMMMRTNRKAPVKENVTLKNPFTSIIYCGLCGSKMTRLGQNRRNRYDTIKCTNRMCNCVSAPIFLVEEELIKSLKKWLIVYQTEISKRGAKNGVSDTKIVQNTIADLEAEVHKIDVQISATYDLLEQGVYTRNVFLERNKTLSERKEKLSCEVANLQRTLIEAKHSADMKEQIIPNVQRIIKSYNDCTNAEEKNNLLRCFIGRIDYIKETPNTRGNLCNTNFKLNIFPVLPNDSGDGVG